MFITFFHVRVFGAGVSMWWYGEGVGVRGRKWVCFSNITKEEGRKRKLKGGADDTQWKGHTFRFATPKVHRRNNSLSRRHIERGTHAIRDHGCWHQPTEQPWGSNQQSPSTKANHQPITLKTITVQHYAPDQICSCKLLAWPPFACGIST